VLKQRIGVEEGKRESLSPNKRGLPGEGQSHTLTRFEAQLINKGNKLMKINHKYIGLDVHKEQNQVAIADGVRDGEVRFYGSITNDLHAVEKLARKLGESGEELHFVYEAGPCGFVIHRRLKQLGIDCIVVAPSLIPKKSGDRVKTNRRDALELARLHRAGELNAIHVPDERDEAIRDLCRSRTDAICEQRNSRYRLKAFLLRNGYKYQSKTSWTEAHMRYLRELVLTHPAQKIVLEEYLLAISESTERIKRLNEAIEVQVKEWRMYPVVEALMGLRGVQLLTAAVLISELGDLNRFQHPRQLMGYLGLVSSEYSSGEKRYQGAITKAGNHHARWFIVESSQHYRLPPKVSKELSRRQENLPQKIKEISWKAQLRLHKRFWALAQRGKLIQKAQVAVARELTGFIWAIAREVRPVCDRKQQPTVSSQTAPKLLRAV
jgi:transposase